MGETIGKGDATMEESELSPEAQRERQAVKESNVRLRAERLAWEERARALEALVLRKEEMVRRQQEFLAEIQAERQAIEAEYQRILAQSIPT
jgi:hypothetical protein